MWTVFVFNSVFKKYRALTLYLNVILMVVVVIPITVTL